MDIKKAVKNLELLEPDDLPKKFLEKYGNVDAGDIPITEGGATLNDLMFVLSQRTPPNK